MSCLRTWTKCVVCVRVCARVFLSFSKQSPNPKNKYVVQEGLQKLNYHRCSNFHGFTGPSLMFFVALGKILFCPSMLWEKL